MKNTLKALRGLRRVAKNNVAIINSNGIFIKSNQCLIKLALPFGFTGVCEALPLIESIIANSGEISAFVVNDNKLKCNGEVVCDFEFNEEYLQFDFKPESNFREFNDSKAFRSFCKVAINGVSSARTDNVFENNYLAINNGNAFILNKNLVLFTERKHDTAEVWFTRDNLEVLNSIDVLFTEYSHVDSIFQLKNDILTVFFMIIPTPLALGGYNRTVEVNSVLNNLFPTEFDVLDLRFFDLVKSNSAATFVTISPTEVSLDTGEKMAIDMPTSVVTTYLVKDIKLIGKYLNMVQFTERGCAFINNEVRGMLANVFIS